MSARVLQKLFNPFEELAKIAEVEIGTCESPRGTNMGQAIRKYKQVTRLNPDKAWPWCMAFVCWCLQRFSNLCRKLVYFKNPPRMAAVAEFFDWALKSGFKIFYPSQVKAGREELRRGDIAIYNFSHCGIVISVDPDLTFFSAAEGNTDRSGSREGWEVAARVRTFKDVDYFARPPARALLVEKKGKKK